jgi:hypothetical protein
MPASFIHVYQAYGLRVYANPERVDLTPSSPSPPNGQAPISRLDPARPACRTIERWSVVAFLMVPSGEPGCPPPPCRMIILAERFPCLLAQVVMP